MKPKLLLPVIFFSLSIYSCTSEYEECLKEGRNLKARLSSLEKNNVMISEESINIEAKEIYNEINLLAKVSGNEHLFLKEVFEN
jgi:hypothetical protein